MSKNILNALLVLFWALAMYGIYWTIAYRIKPKQSEWWENIPEHGVLCWWNGMIITVIRRRNHYIRQGTNGTVEWVDGEVVPLTNEEIEGFKR